VQQHLPNGRVTPVVGGVLRPDFDSEVVVGALEDLGLGLVDVVVEADEVSPHVLERVVKSLFVVFSLALAVAEDAISIPAEDEHTPLVHSVQGGHVGHTVRVNEDQGEVCWIKHLVELWSKVALWSCRVLLTRLGLSAFKVHCVVFLLQSVLFLVMFLLSQVVVVLDLLAATQLLKHDHLVLPVFG